MKTKKSDPNRLVILRKRFELTFAILQGGSTLEEIGSALIEDVNDFCYTNLKEYEATIESLRNWRDLPLMSIAEVDQTLKTGRIPS
jgi:hypothetical protein